MQEKVVKHCISTKELMSWSKHHTQKINRELEELDKNAIFNNWSNEANMMQQDIGLMQAHKDINEYMC